VDDINRAIDTYDNFKEVKDAVDAYRKGDLDEHAKDYVIQNLASAAYEGITGKVIDETVPKNGDPIHDSMNDFLHTGSRVLATKPTIEGAIDRVKTVFKDLTGNMKDNLN